jgi:hypothetical protein
MKKMNNSSAKPHPQTIPEAVNSDLRRLTLR